METILKSKLSWQYMKTMIPNPTDDYEKFVVDGKKDEVVGVITTYISQEIQFHIIGIDFPHQVQKNLMSLFDGVDEIHAIGERVDLSQSSFFQNNRGLFGECEGTLVEIG